MIPYLHPSREDEIGICKHVLILFNGERPLQLRLRIIIKFVTNLVKFNTNPYPFLWVFLGFKYIFVIFNLAWLFSSFISIQPGVLLYSQNKLYSNSKSPLSLNPGCPKKITQKNAIYIILCHTPLFDTKNHKKYRFPTIKISYFH